MRRRPNRWQFAARKPFTGRQRAIAHPCLWYCGAVALLWALVTLWGRVHNASIRVVARLCSNGAAFVSRLFPIPLSEWLVFLAVAALVALPVWGAVRRGKRGLAKGLCRSLALLLTIGLWFSLFWGVNYDAAPLAQQLGLEVKPRSVDELYAAAQTLLEDANRLADQVERDGGDDCAAGDFSAMSQDLWEDYQTLGQQAPLYRSAVARRPKQALVLGPLMPWVGIAGYYFPFSAEPVVGPTVPTHTAYNIAHELAHSLGVAPEDEAGFSAYLACMESEDPLIQYSGALNAYIYASNALYDYAPDRANDLSAQVNENLRHDILALNAFLAQFEGPVQQAGDAINDTYLRVQRQEQGLNSYGNMVDLLMAYLDQQGELGGS